MQFGIAVSVFALIWCAAVLVKIATTRGRSYRFTQWDGGLMLRGTELGRTGTALFACFTILLAGAATIMLVLWASL